ncbi:MAG: diphthine--ammonia ligase [Methanosarcinales archaeon]|jgi:ABC transporter with metal-binding/Fe-S-binding domain ATP-binding protein|nr:diphthine--ammonia ligase [Methanosarcinales archaeon]
MKIAALVSGGKDSVFAVQKMIAGGHEIVCFVCLAPENKESYMFHSINTDLVRLIAAAAEIPLIFKTIEGVKEEELNEMKEALSEAVLVYGAQGVCSGAIESEYQRGRIQNICASLGLAAFSPLWKADPVSLLTDMIDSGLDIRFAAVAADGLDASWLGRRLDRQTLADLIKLHQTRRIHIAGEGGEFETAVFDASFFKKKINPVKTNVRWYGSRGFYDISESELILKNETDERD